MEQHHNTIIPAMRIIAAAMAAAGLSITAAQATTPTGFVGTQVARGAYGDIDLKLKTGTFDLKLDTKGASDIYVTRNAIAIGGQSGWHTHPGPSLITVTVGTITAYDDELCTPHVYNAGEGFVDAGDGDVHLLRNESGAVAETVAVQFVAAGAARRIDAPQPNNCNF